MLAHPSPLPLSVTSNWLFAIISVTDSSSKLYMIERACALKESKQDSKGAAARRTLGPDADHLGPAQSGRPTQRGGVQHTLVRAHAAGERRAIGRRLGTRSRAPSRRRCHGRCRRPPIRIPRLPLRGPRPHLRSPARL